MTNENLSNLKRAAESKQLNTTQRQIFFSLLRDGPHIATKSLLKHSPLSDHQACACGFAKFVVIGTCSFYFIHALCNWVTGQIQNCLAVT